MRKLCYFLVLVLLLSNCAGDETNITHSWNLAMKAHNSNNEFYENIPVDFGVKLKQGVGPDPAVVGFQLWVDGKKTDNTIPQHSFEAGTYGLRALVTLPDGITYPIDTVINITKRPPVFGNVNRGEKVLFGWRAGSSYKALLGTYHGSSVLDYEVLDIDESLEQIGSLSKMNLGWYPEITDHTVSQSGNMAIIYDNTIDVFDPALILMYHASFNHGKVPRKVFFEDDNQLVLLFDSLAHIRLAKLDVSTGQILNGTSRFVGVEEMTAYEHFFFDGGRTAIYYVGPNNSRTLLMGVDMYGGSVEFSQYFQPPVFIERVTPLSSGGYVVGSFLPEQQGLTILGADHTNVVKWSRTLQLNSRNSTYVPSYHRLAVKELDGFFYVFFDNMRCVKFTFDGRVVWDKYFYPMIAGFADVHLTPSGEFIILGTRQGTVDNQLDHQLKTDVVAIKINKDGMRTEK